MTREELKAHCIRQVEQCEMWAKLKEKEPSGKVYEEHKLILELLEQDPCEDAISRQAIVQWLENATDDSIEHAIDSNLEFIPSVTPQPKTGQWVSISIKGEIDGQIVKAFTCSKCGAISVFRMTDGKIVNGDLCANCGCRMINPQESEE